MKLIIVLCLILCLTFSLSTKVTEKSSINMSNEIKAKLDYLHYINQQNLKNEDNQYAFKEKNDEKKKDENKEPEMLENWMTIQSEEFLNTKRFPSIKGKDGEEKIKINPLGFRINTTIDCKDKNKPDDDRNFWFRLTKNSLFYSSTKTDLNVLGIIEIKNLFDIDKSSDISGSKEYFCFNVSDSENKEWKICNIKIEERNKWYCNIAKRLSKQDELCGKGSSEGDKPKTKKKKIIMIPLPSPTCNEDWNYEKMGHDWVCDCKEGMEQSPIDLSRSISIESPEKPVFTYKEVSKNDNTTVEGVMSAGDPVFIRNSDNKIHILDKDFGKVTTMDGTVYKAQEISFHTPSNHRINGKQFPLEISIIHYGVTKGDIGKQLILSFVFDAAPGIYNSFLEDLDVFNLPDPVEGKKPIGKTLYIPKILYEYVEGNTQKSIMKPFSFYTYNGSLPFPPCTERTINLVASKPLRVSTTTLTLLKEALKKPDFRRSDGKIISNDKNPSSNRDTQPLNNRKVYFYDHEKYCGVDKIENENKKVGHYEKVVNVGSQYFYVSGEKPSGLPGSFVVSEDIAKGINKQ